MGRGHAYVTSFHHLHRLHRLHHVLNTTKKTPGVSAMQTNADENGTRTRATFVTRKYAKITLTWRHNQLGHLTTCRMLDEEVLA